MNKNILLLGHRNFVGNYLKFFLKKKFNLLLINSHFLESEVLNLSEKKFYIKYFYKKFPKIDIILNLIHISKNHLLDELKINKKFINKIIYLSKASNSKLIFLSSVNSRFDKKNKYAYSKKAIENRILTLENYLIIRPSTIIQNKNNEVIGGKNGKSLEIINILIKKFSVVFLPQHGDFLHTITFIEDLGSFIGIVCKKDIFKKKIINFFSGEYLSYRDFIKCIVKKYKKKVLYIHIPLFIIRFFFIFFGLFFLKKINLQMLNNLLNQKIEFDFSKKINKFYLLNKININ